MRYEDGGWVIETAGWQVVRDDGTVALTPADADAALIITAFRKAQGPISDDELQAFATRGSPPDAERRAVACGAFRGYHTAYSDGDVYWRVWWLGAGALHLYLTFNAPLAVRGHHDSVLDWMLASLAVAADAA